mmetsp:Transcript_36307/g.94436  ORF Transcript_36307/g.94436 Transcript_36307/m.94436 type:complete len:714 (-) Transcript_36307:62-2203(-)
MAAISAYLLPLSLLLSLSFFATADDRIPDHGLLLGPLLGAVTSKSVKVWVRGVAEVPFSVSVQKGREGEDDEKARREANVPITHHCHILLRAEDDYSAACTVEGLSPDTSYVGIVQLDGQRAVPLIGDGENFFSFTTFHSPDRDHTLPTSTAFAVGSCILHLDRPFPIFDDISSFHPRFMLMLGDQTYIDYPPYVIQPDNHTWTRWGSLAEDAEWTKSLEMAPVRTVEEYNWKYRLTYADKFFARFYHRTPLFMTWDDHDSGRDNYDLGTGSDVYKLSRRAFDLYQGSHNPTWKESSSVWGKDSPRVRDEVEGVYYTLSMPPLVEVFVLDTRSFRSLDSSEDGPAKTMLGDVQKEHLFAWLDAWHEAETDAIQQWIERGNVSAPFPRFRFKLIATSVMMNDYHNNGNDSWGIGFPTEKKEVIEYIRNKKMNGVVFVSADAHWGGLFRIHPYPEREARKGFMSYDIDAKRQRVLERIHAYNGKLADYPIMELSTSPLGYPPFPLSYELTVRLAKNAEDIAIAIGRQKMYTLINAVHPCPRPAYSYLSQHAHNSAVDSMREPCLQISIRNDEGKVLADFTLMASDLLHHRRDVVQNLDVFSQTNEVDEIKDRYERNTNAGWKERGGANTMEERKIEEARKSGAKTEEKTSARSTPPPSSVGLSPSGSGGGEISTLLKMEPLFVGTTVILGLVFLWYVNGRGRRQQRRAAVGEDPR